ncbi:uncharacterized protein L201_001213 [Kwoniella dendrophila CBS 6074]|uniref:CCHC-type domain-containing protein n=1 Tax=Kwoniella dendrophila CBS 6074 TaxID=1295534 RepID=A0AAX4JP61_9TREE
MAKKTSVANDLVEDAIIESGATTTNTDMPSTTTPKTGPRKRGPTVHFQLANGSIKAQRVLKQDVSFNSIASGVFSKLAPNVPTEQIRLSHVRENGREVDLIDEYDFTSFQRRVLDNPTKTHHIKVYIPGTSTHNQSTTVPPTPQPQTPSPAGVQTKKNDDIFETPKNKSIKDKKGKQKVVNDSSEQTSVSTSLQSQIAQQRIEESPMPARDEDTTPNADKVISPHNPPETPTETKSSKKKKRKVSDATEAPLPTSTEIPSLVTPIATPAQADPVGSTENKSAKKKREKQPKTPQSAKPPISSSSFDAPSAQPHISPITPTSTKNKKRKRKSEFPEPSQSSSQESITSSTASSTATSTSIEDPTGSQQRSTSKSPEKKKRKRSKQEKANDEQKTPSSANKQKPTVQIHLSSSTPTIYSPYTQLNRYKPVTPSPLGRMPTPSVDSSVDEESIEELPKSPVKETPKSSKKSEKSKKQSEEVTSDKSNHSVNATAVNGQGDPDVEEEMQVEAAVPEGATNNGKEAVTEPEVPSMDVATAQTVTPAKKERKKSKKKVAAEAELEAEPRTPETQSEETPLIVDTPPQTDKKNSRKKKSAEAAAITPSIAAQSETTEPPVTPAKKEKRKSKKKMTTQEEMPLQEQDVSTTNVATDQSTNAASMEVNPVDATFIPANTKSSEQSVLRIGKPRTNLSKVIPLSVPYILHVRPNDPLPFITSKYNSSMIERSPQQVYGESAKSAKAPKTPIKEVAVEDEDAVSLEEEELPRSPERQKEDELPEQNAVESESEDDDHESAIDTDANKQKDDLGNDEGEAEKAEEQATEHIEGDQLIAETVQPEPAETVNEPEAEAVAQSVTTRRSPSPTPLSKNLSPAYEPSPMDLSKMKQHITSDYHLQLAARGQCIICDGPSHLQKDCPAVLQGVDRLHELLEEKKGRKKNQLRESSIEAIENWINRLDKIANSVKGNKSRLTTPKKITTKSPATTPITQLPIPALPKEKPISARELSTPPDSAEPSIVSQSSTPEPVASPEPAPIPSQPSHREQSSSPEPSASPEPAPKPSQQSQRAQSPPREHSAPPIYFKALSKKAGSVSGLSVSDAVIETGSSESESDSDDSGSEGDSESGSEEDSDAESIGSRGSSTSGTRSRNGSRSESADSPARSPSPLSRKQGSGSYGTPSLNDFMSMPLSQNLKRRARESAAGMKDVNMDEEIEDASEPESTPERQLPPSSFVARGVRAGSESSVGEFADEKSDEDVDMDEEDEVMPFTQSLDIIEPKQVENEETVNPVPPEEEEEESRRKPLSPPPTNQSRKSFTDLAVASSPTPMVDELPGSIALQEAIDEDDASERLMDVDSPSKSEEGKTGHIISQGLMSPPSSTGENTQEEVSVPMPATQLVNGNEHDEEEEEEPTPRPLRRRVTRGMAKEQEDTELAPPIRLSSSQPAPTPSSPPRRRLRSMSREPTIEPMSPRITTRRVSSSQPQPERSTRFRSSSPSSSLPIPVRRSTRRTTPSSQIDELASSPIAVQPRRSSRRGTTPLRSSQSQIDQLDSSPPEPLNKAPEPIPEEDESTVEAENETPNDDDEQEQGDSTQRTPETMKIPLVPETQESEPRLNSRALRSRPSPLFMSQGSQIPQTQAYNLYPNLPSSDTGTSINETPKGKTTGNNTLAESPLSERKSNGLNRKSSLRFTSPILEDEHEEEGINEEEQEEPRLDQVKDSQPQDEESEEDVSDKGMNGVVQVNGNGNTNDNKDESQSSSSASSKSNSGSDSSDNEELLPKLRSTRSTSSLYPKLPSTLPRASTRLSTLSSSQPQQPTFSSAFPTLSSLSKDALRSRASFGFPSSSQPNPSTPSMTNSSRRTGNSRISLPANNNQMGNNNTRKRNGFSLSQPNPKVDSSESESESGSDSSEEEKTPAGLKGRFAKGGRDKSKMRRASQANIGW